MRDGARERLRLRLPGAAEIAAAVMAVLPRRSDGRIRLCDKAGRVVHVLRADERLLWGTRVIVWKGRAFLRWEGNDWQEVLMTQVLGKGDDDNDE